MNAPAVSETFIQRHIDHLPGDKCLIHGYYPQVGSTVTMSRSVPARVAYKAYKALAGREYQEAFTRGYVKAFKIARADAVLVEYGLMGVRVMHACERAGVPMFVHFHGYDASVYQVLHEYRDRYLEMFSIAKGLIVVSREMRRTLISLGAPKEKVHYVPSGVDCDRFSAADPLGSAPVFLMVGRLVPKKGPDLLINAFAHVVKACPESRLRIVGEGSMMKPCQLLAEKLGISKSVTFLGAQPHAVVAQEMRQARALALHSVKAFNGDSEGTPNVIYEAGASGLPVVSTLHAGIPDVVVDGVTGYLVEEFDTESMAERMIQLAKDPSLAHQMGQAARKSIHRDFSSIDCHARLRRILDS